MIFHFLFFDCLICRLINFLRPIDHFFFNRLIDQSVGRVVNKVRVEGGEATFNPYLYVPKYVFSDALPAPEIFFKIILQNFL